MHAVIVLLVFHSELQEPLQTSVCFCQAVWIGITALNFTCFYVVWASVFVDKKDHSAAVTGMMIDPARKRHIQ